VEPAQVVVNPGPGHCRLARRRPSQAALRI